MNPLAVFVRAVFHGNNATPRIHGPTSRDPRRRQDRAGRTRVSGSKRSGLEAGRLGPRGAVADFAANILQARKCFPGFGGAGETLADLEDVARSWARTDPGAAASAVYKLNQGQLWIERSGVGAEVIALWVAERPQEAIGWARSLPDGPARRHVVTTVFRAFASTDPKMALDAVIDWPDESERGAAVAAVLSSWASTDLPAAARAFESLSDPTARRESVFTIGNRMAKANPVEAFNWATTLPTEESARILPSIVGVQAQRDISVARRMVESVREHEAIQQVAGYFASAWVDQDPTAALRWAQSELSGDVLRSTMKHIFATWATNDPTGAAHGLSMIESRELSDQAALTLLQSCERPTCNRLYKNLSGDVALEKGKRIMGFRFADFDDVAG